MSLLPHLAAYLRVPVRRVLLVTLLVTLLALMTAAAIAHSFAFDFAFALHARLLAERSERTLCVCVCVCVCVAANEIGRDAHIGVLWRDIYRNKCTRQSE